MARVFPLTPTLNQEVTVGSKKFQWDGNFWKRVKVTEDTVQAVATTTEVAAQTYTDSAVSTAVSTAVSGLASESFVNTAIANLADSAPATLDTLNELAAALGDDPNFATTITNSIAAKADSSHNHAISDVTNLQTSLNNKTDKLQSHVTKTANYFLQASDNQYLILCNGTFEIGVPMGTFSGGERIDFINTGTGVITFADYGVTILSKDASLTLDTQYAAASLVFVSGATAYLVGSLA